MKKLVLIFCLAFVMPIEADEQIALNCQYDPSREAKTLYKFRSHKVKGSFNISFKIPKPNSDCIGEACNQDFYGEPTSMFGSFKAEFIPSCSYSKYNCSEPDKQFIIGPSLDYELNKKYPTGEPPKKLYDSYILNYQERQKYLKVDLLQQRYQGYNEWKYSTFGELMVVRENLNSSLKILDGLYYIHGTCKLIKDDVFLSQFNEFKKMKEDKLKEEQEAYKNSLPERVL